MEENYYIQKQSEIVVLNLVEESIDKQSNQIKDCCRQW